MFSIVKKISILLIFFLSQVLWASSQMPGEIIWQYSQEYPLKKPVLDKNGDLYSMSFQRNKNQVFKLNSQGKEVWRVDLEATHKTDLVLGENEVLYTFLAYVPYHGYIVKAFSLSGHMLWNKDLPYGYYFSNQSHQKGLYLYAWDPPSGSTVIALDFSGGILWQFPIPHLLRSEMVVDENGAIFIASNDGWLYSISSQGKLLWQQQIESKISWRNKLIATKNGRIYYQRDEGLFAVDNSAKIIWYYSMMNTSWELIDFVADKENNVYLLQNNLESKKISVIALNKDKKQFWQSAISTTGKPVKILLSPDNILYVFLQKFSGENEYFGAIGMSAHDGKILCTIADGTLNPSHTIFAPDGTIYSTLSGRENGLAAIRTCKKNK